MSGAGHDGGHVRVTLGVDLDDQGKFEQFERQKERARRNDKITAHLGADMDPKTEGVVNRYNDRLDKVEERVRQKERFKAALGAEFDAQAFDQAWRAMQREERRVEREREAALRDEAKRTEKIRVDAAKAVDKLNADMARRQAAREEEIQRESARRARAIVKERERAAYDIAKAEHFAYAEEERRAQRHREAMTRAEVAGHAEDERRTERAFRDRERAQQRHMQRRERMLGQVTKGAGNFIPDVTWSTRVPGGGIVAFAAAAQAAIPPVVALAGSLAPLVGWLGAIPTVASAAGIGLLTAFLGFKGVGDALGASWEAQASAAEDGVDTAKRQEAALEQVKNAERQLADAIVNHDDAQQDANDTTREARREMRALRGELDDLAASEGDRVEALRQANEEVGRLRAEGAGQREIAVAQREVVHAEQALTEARDRRREATDKVAQVDKHGIESLDEVKDANDRVADAEQRVTDAAEGVGKANRGATRDMAELQGGAKKLDEAMRELSPSGQAFVTLIATKFFPLAKQLRATAQDGLLPGLGDGLVEASANASILDRVVGRIAKTMGGTGLDWGTFLGSKSFGRDFEQIMGQSNDLLDHGGDASIHFASGLRHVAVESEPLVGWLGRITEQLGLNFEGWAKTNRENGRMRGFFRETVQTTKDVVGTLVDLGAGLWNIARIGARVWGNDMRGGIRDAAKDFRDWTDSVKGDRSIEQYFTRWRRRWTAVVDYIGDAIDEYRKLRKEGMSATSALTRVLTDRFGEALVTLAERIGRLAPKVAAGFIKGFIDADAWGKLFIGAWLLGKLGGRGAFLAIGRTLGGWLGLGLLAGAKQSGIAMQLAAWFKDPKRTGRMTAAGSVMGRSLGLGISAGIVLAIPLIGAAVAEALNDARKKIQGWIEDLPGGKALNDVTNFIGKNVPTGLVPGLEYTKHMFGGNDQMREDFEKLNRDLGGKVSVETDKPSFTRAKKELADLETDSEKRLKSIRKSMGRETAAGAKAAKENFQDTAKVIQRRVKDGELSTEQGMRAIRRLVKTHSEGAKGSAVKEFDEMGRKVTRRLKNTKDDGGKQAKGLKNAVTGAIGGMTEFVNGTLKGLGLKPIDFKASKVSSDVASGADKIASGEVRASGGFAGMFAGGGLIGRWGERGRDKVHAILGRGEAVLNHYQQKVVNSALMQKGIRGLPDLFRKTKSTRHYMASGGVAGGDGASIGDYYPEAFATGGLVGSATQAAQRIEKAQFPYLWGGGHSGSPAPFGPFDCSGAVSYVLQNAGINIPTMVSGAMMNIGKPGPGPITVFANPEHVFMRIGQKYFGTSGENPGGGAGWFSGGTPEYQAGFTQRHFGEGDASAVPGIPDVPGFKIDGPEGPLRDMAQRMVNRVRRGAMRKLQEVAGESMGGGDVGNWVVDSPDLKAINHRFDKHFTGERGPSLSERLTKKLASWARLPSWFPRIWKGESENQPGIVNSADGGIGLGQETPSAWPAGSVLHGIMGALGGYEEMRNPLAQAQMNREHLDLAPSQTPNTLGFPWYGTKHLAGGGFAGDGASIGDYMPSAGAFAAGGYTDDSAPVNIGGAVGPGGMLTGIGNKLLGSSPIEAIKTRISRNESRYQSLSRRFELNDEEFIAEGTETTPPTLNMAAIDDRAGDLRKLIAIRDDIYSDYQRLVFYIRRLRAVYRQMMNRLARSVERVKGNIAKVGKGKDADKRRKTLQGRLGEYQGALKGASGKFSTLGVELGEAQQGRYDAHTDLLADQQELDTLLPGAKADLSSQLDRGGGSGDDDLQAQLDQANQKVANLEEFKRIARAGFDVFQGPGDIGAGDSYALQAARNPQGSPGGAGPGLGLSMGDDGRLYDGGGQVVTNPFRGGGTSGAGGGAAPQIVQHFHSPIPATTQQLDDIGRAATAGQSLQGAVQANRKAVNV
jgi:hypothetical protein